jgi:hypothetical protein
MNKTVAVFEGEQFDGDDWPTPGYPATLVGCIAWFNAKLQLIPEEYRDEARCEVSSRSSYYEGGNHGYIRIEYDRPETDVEAAEREAAERDRAAVKKHQDLALLQQLLEKYKP